MIEAIVKYIEDKGFTVNVRPGVLLIRKRWRGELISMNWSIAREELNQAYEPVLIWKADRYMSHMDEAIRKREEGL